MLESGLEDSEAAEARWAAAESFSDYEEISEGFLRLGRQALSRAMDYLSPSAMFPHVLPFIFNTLDPPTNPAAGSEKNRLHAALYVLSEIIRNAKDVQLTQRAIEVTLPFFSLQSTLSPPISPLIVYAAINCVAQMTIYFSPDIQQNYHQAILPSLLFHTSRENSFSTLLRVHAIATIASFVEYGPHDVTMIYLEAILGRLIAASSEGPLYVLETSVSAIATVAGAVGQSFGKYYTAVAPIMKGILSRNDPAHEAHLVKAKVIEAFSVLFTVTDASLCINDMEDVMNSTTTFSFNVLAPEDPLRTYIIKCWTRIALATGAAFAPYLSRIVPQLAISLRDYQKNSPHSGSSAEEDEEERDEAYWDDEDEEEEGAKDFEGQEYEPSYMEEVAASLHSTLILAEKLQHRLFPYVEILCNPIEKLTRSYHKDVRCYAVTTLTALTLCVARHASFDAEAQKGRAVPLFLGFVLQANLKTLFNEDSLEVMMCAVQSIERSLALASFPYSASAKAIMGDLSLETILEKALSGGMSDGRLSRVLTGAQAEAVVQGATLAMRQSEQRKCVRFAEATCKKKMGEYDEVSCRKGK